VYFIHVDGGSVVVGQAPLTYPHKQDAIYIDSEGIGLDKLIYKGHRIGANTLQLEQRGYTGKALELAGWLLRREVPDLVRVLSLLTYLPLICVYTLRVGRYTRCSQE
jgi:hypothetical protein